MSLDERLENLRSRPQAEKRQIAFWTAGILTFVIAGLWFLNFTFLSDLSTPAETPVVAAETESPVAGFSEIVSDNFGRISRGWSVLSDQAASLVKMVQAVPATTTLATIATTSATTTVVATTTDN